MIVLTHNQKYAIVRYLMTPSKGLLEHIAVVWSDLPEDERSKAENDCSELREQLEQFVFVAEEYLTQAVSSGKL